jgi:phosphoglycolate phosphatase-like HAD superfamily hydrolase
VAQELTLWQPGGSRQAIEDFVAGVTTDGSPDFVPPEARIAVFDNDGTLWTEKPMPIELGFILQRLAALADEDPALREQQPFRAAREKDYQWLGDVITRHYKGDDSDVKVLIGGILEAFGGMSVEAYQADATAFLTSAPHPTLGRLLRECGYAPMVELLRYLEAHGFVNYIASGGDRDFMRVVTEEIYGIPAERVIGSSNALCYVEDDTCGQVEYLAKPDVFDDGPAKPVRIWSRIGRRPILVGGNSNGDIQMLQFAGGDRPALRLLLLHDDAEREFAYTAGAEKSLELARARGWQVVSMKDEWKAMFAAPGRKASAAGAPGGA